jgi:hypothetical protein
MRRKTLVWLLIVALVAITLGAASLIVASNPGTPMSDETSGFLH